MKYSFENFHIWYQYGLNLICEEKVSFFYNKVNIDRYQKYNNFFTSKF
jgi:hypothetical protein